MYGVVVMGCWLGGAAGGGGVLATELVVAAGLCVGSAMIAA